MKNYIKRLPALLLILLIALSFTPIQAKEIPKQNSSVEEIKWYEGGDLHSKNGLEWQEATPENKLATCADLTAAMWKNKLFKKEILKNIKSIDDLKPYSEELLEGLDKAFEKDQDEVKNKKLFTNQKVAETSFLLATMMKWLEV